MFFLELSCFFDDPADVGNLIDLLCWLIGFTQRNTKPSPLNIFKAEGCFMSWSKVHCLRVGSYFPHRSWKKESCPSLKASFKVRAPRSWRKRILGGNTETKFLKYLHIKGTEKKIGITSFLKEML